MTDILETLILIAFGLSWPPAIYTSLTTRSIAGKSLLFEICIWFGYAFGIIAKTVCRITHLCFSYVCMLSTFLRYHLISSSISAIRNFVRVQSRNKQTKLIGDTLCITAST